jgi:signal transduction histidine kinase
MASLGQLITGIAHELNNPIGAIRATSKNSEIIFKELLELLIDSSHLLVQLTPSEWQSILEFSNVSGRVSNFFHGSEARVIKRNLIEKLQSEKIENVEDIADSFVDVGISECPESIIEILKNRKDSYKLIITLAHFSKNQSTINFATERISKVIYSLKNFSRVNNSGEKVKTNLIENIETVLTLYQNQFRFDVNVVRTYNPIPEIYCYQEDLFHVWSNLIYNALQAMQFKGTLEIITDYLADFVRVTIKDNGAGIPVEVQEMIFKPFFTTKKSGEGTGLGLDIARRIVEKHSGQILFDSVPGETSFYIYLPLE